MPFQYTLFVILAPIATIISILTLVFAWRNRKAKGALRLSILITLIIGWLVFNTFELISGPEDTTLFWAKVTYLFISSVPVAWTAFAIQYTERGKFFAGRRIILLGIIPVITTILIWTNETQHLVWKEYHFSHIGNFTAFSVSYGWWFWINTAYIYILVIHGSYLIAREYFYSSRLYRQQSVGLLLGATIPLLVNFVYIFRLIPGLRKDYSPISFAFAGTAIAIGILRYRLFDLKPIAYRSLIENMSDGILVLDDQNRIVDFNPAFESIIDVPINQALGQPALFVLKPWRDIVERFQNETNIHTEISIDLQGSIRHYDLRISPLYYREIIYGRLILLRDITARKQAEEQLLKFATTDSLTGLLNRRHFFSLAEKEFERSRRYNHDLSVIMFDIDHFKRVNDEYGHAVGDVVLQAIADTFKQSNREIDLIARWGGEEFVILLPETGLLPAQKTAERLRSIIESTPIGTDVVVITITISAGVTSMSDEEDLSVETLLNRADIALYQSKDRGRNRVTVWRRSQEES